MRNGHQYRIVLPLIQLLFFLILFFEFLWPGCVQPIGLHVLPIEGDDWRALFEVLFAH